MKAAFAALIGIPALWYLTGCGGDSGSDSDKTGNPPTSAATNTLAGHTWQFTVTRSLQFSEPEGAVYSVRYTQTSYAFFPSPMNRETTMEEDGAYSYNPTTGAIHYFRPDHQDLDGVVTFTSSMGGTIHLNGPEGEMEDATFVQISFEPVGI